MPKSVSLSGGIQAKSVGNTSLNFDTVGLDLIEGDKTSTSQI